MDSEEVTVWSRLHSHHGLNISPCSHGGDEAVSKLRTWHSNRQVRYVDFFRSTSSPLLWLVKPRFPPAEIEHAQFLRATILSCDYTYHTMQFDRTTKSQVCLRLQSIVWQRLERCYDRLRGLSSCTCHAASYQMTALFLPDNRKSACDVTYSTSFLNTFLLIASFLNPNLCIHHSIIMQNATKNGGDC